ncbi:Macrophage killing protein with similarity to conjugation protein [Legionella lansingensis]|uniref:Macrophage killing protein with similarity to conjugation protein n=1 Tax=Legionella lansingensis TaxID=45067 RepID=A0A0W0VV65_9GAMM|nr:hypothetical protein [Legionella lansingensis]KTD23789.1 Macrophage killing protein with similarity to conjugation protein [Legionella lansingensis]SNV47232.1 Macrophage killing protein with similarity to conjugation protein [Legionella lansingensis]
MKKIHCSHLLLISFLLLPTLLYSQRVVHMVLPNYPAQQVIEWTEQTLMTTLTAGYHEDVSEAANVRKRYLHLGWIPMQSFLREKLRVIGKQEIMLHPEPITPPVIIQTEDCEGASCWHVHQAFLIPELRNKVDFTALVITADPAHGSPFLIKSLSIASTDY